MNRFGGSYVFAAASGTAVIASAIVAFVLLVTVHSLNEWPLQDFGFSDSGTSAVTVGKAHAVTPARAAHAGHAGAAGAAVRAGAGSAPSAGAAGGGAGVVHHGGANAPGGTSVPHTGGAVSPASTTSPPSIPHTAHPGRGHDVTPPPSAATPPKSTPDENKGGSTPDENKGGNPHEHVDTPSPVAPIAPASSHGHGKGPPASPGSRGKGHGGPHAAASSSAAPPPVLELPGVESEPTGPGSNSDGHGHQGE